jgi:hypothetical protein
MTGYFNSKILVPEHVLIRVFENESVLLNLESESYHGLDNIGTRMWQTLTRSENVQAAYKALLAEYEVDADSLRKDLTAFIDQLMERGLVKIS